MNSCQNTKVRISIVSIFVSFLLLGCSDESLKRRAERCDTYFKVKGEDGTELKNCNTNFAVFKKGAERYTRLFVAEIYPAVLRTKAKLDKELQGYPILTHSKIPDNIDPLLFIDDKEAEKNWRYYIKLKDVIITGPESGEGSKNWDISGTKITNGQPFSASILGIAPYALREIDGLCYFFINSSGKNGCSATVYFDLLKDGESLPSLTVMAIDFIPPTQQEAERTFLQNELGAWDPIKH